MQVDFYQLSHDPVERAVALIAGKVLGQGGRMLVVASEPASRTALGEALWSAGSASFLANAEAGGEHDSRQPILLAAAVTPANGARNVALADGIWREEVLAEDTFDRAFLLFDERTVAAARDTWRTLRAQDGLAPNFWKQVDGRWTKAA